jgi:hypothetical protein
MAIIRFDREKTTFDPNKLKIHHLEKFAPKGFTFNKIKLSYDNKKIKLRLPIANLNGIYYNEELNTHTLIYPKSKEENEETVEFLKWITAFQNYVQNQLEKYNIQNIFKKNESGENLYIKFYSAENKLQQQCFDLKGRKQDINKVASWQSYGKYIVIIDIPSVYISENEAHGSKFQIYGNTVFASTRFTQSFNAIDILGKDLDKKDSDMED